MAATTTYGGGGGVSIPVSGNGSPYPSTITVSGFTGTVGKVTATVTGITHAYPDDISILLAGPGGQSVVLMSHTGGGYANSLTGVNVTFDDSAATSLSAALITNGTYKPTNIGTVNFAGPAPASPYGTALSVFNGVDPNGTWSLYVMDTVAPDGGSISGWSLSITDSTVPPTFTSGAPASGLVGTAYSHTFTASGTPAPTFSVTSGSLPTGLSLNSAGLLNGTPTATGSFTFTVTATNGVSPDATQTVTVLVSNAPVAPTFTSGAPINGTVNNGYHHTFTANGYPAPTFTVTGGALPPGLALDPTSGALTGTPTVVGSFNFTVTASNGVAPDATQSVTLIVGTTPVTQTTLPTPPPPTLCTDVNFEEPGMIRSHFTNDIDRAGLRCSLIAAGKNYRMWLGGPIAFAANIGNQTVLDLGLIAAVDVYSTSAQTGFVGDVDICLQGKGYMIYMNANSSPRVPQLWSAWTTDAFPGYTCTTLYAPGTVILVERHP